MTDVTLISTDEIIIDNALAKFITDHATSFYSFDDPFNNDEIEECSQENLLRELSKRVSEKLSNDIGRNFIENKQGFFYKVLYQSKFAGFILLERVEEPDQTKYPSGFQFELTIGIFDEYQGEGIAKNAIQKAIILWKEKVDRNETLSALVKKCNIDKDAVVNILQNTGFEIQDESNTEIFFLFRE